VPIEAPSVRDSTHDKISLPKSCFPLDFVCDCEPRATIRPMRLLIVEDDIRITTPLKEDLENQSFLVDVAHDGHAAWDMYRQNQYDLVLLDWMVPGISGAELCSRMRQNGFDRGILMLTARGEKHDKIFCLDSGADDYVVKPFDIDELGARIRALVRRAGGAKDGLKHGRLSIDLRACTALYAGSPLDLTPTEYRLLLQFVRNPKRVFSKAELVERVWSVDDMPSESVIKTHIKSLRQKLMAAGSKKDLIATIYGFGYRLNESL
jgi:DNA-binding response OmpR family regulator